LNEKTRVSLLLQGRGDRLTARRRPLGGFNNLHDVEITADHAFNLFVVPKAIHEIMNRFGARSFQRSQLQQLLFHAEYQFQRLRILHRHAAFVAEYFPVIKSTEDIWAIDSAEISPARHRRV
jgi:hypothetical protein